MNSDPLLEKEIDRIANETFMDANALEKRVALELVVKIVILIFRGYPANVCRMASEILHKYFSLVEGIERDNP